jgi:SAM-dependent methyltransferase
MDENDTKFRKMLKNPCCVIARGVCSAVRALFGVRGKNPAKDAGAAGFWNAMLDDKRYGRWFAHPLLQQEWFDVIFREHGAPTYIDWLAKRINQINPAEILVPCCGDGHFERAVARKGVAARFHCLDIADQAVAQARRAARDLPNLVYEVADINTASLSENRYGLCMAVNSLHHVENLEHFFDRLRSALKPGGMIIMTDYVGPSRLQWSAEVCSMAQPFLDMLPRQYRRTGPTDIYEKVQPPDLQALMKADPSEAVRSADILPALSQRFDVADKIDFGGAIIMPVLMNIIENFPPDDDEARALVRAICRADRDRLLKRQAPTYITLELFKKR